MRSTDVVTVRGLRKSYGKRVVVDDLDLDVPVSQIVGLIGANGAGKTTTVECLQGLRKPDAGELRVLGYDPVTQAADLRPHVGSQLQDSALPDRLRVGKTNGEIANALFVSEPTVKTHVNHVFAKLGLRDRAAAVIFAFDHNLTRRR